jgi:hypothetical protein
MILNSDENTKADLGKLLFLWVTSVVLIGFVSFFRFRFSPFEEIEIKDQEIQLLLNHKISIQIPFVHIRILELWSYPGGSFLFIETISEKTYLWGSLGKISTDQLPFPKSLKNRLQTKNYDYKFLISYPLLFGLPAIVYLVYWIFFPISPYVHPQGFALLCNILWLLYIFYAPKPPWSKVTRSFVLAMGLFVFQIIFGIRIS